MALPHVGHQNIRHVLGFQVHEGHASMYSETYLDVSIGDTIVKVGYQEL